MAQALQDIITELNSVYNPQRDSYNAQIASIDPQQQADLSGLNATKQSAFGDITNQANRNGLFYSGLPIAEEQKYVGGTYLPAVANLQSKYAAQKFGLQDALAKVTQDQYNQAYTVRQNQLDTEQRAQAAANALAAQRAASAASSASPSFGSFGGAGASAGGGNTAAPAINPLAAATDFANTQKQVAQAGGQVPTFFRDSVFHALQRQYGSFLSPQQISDIVYKQVFPDNWNGGATGGATTGVGSGAAGGGGRSF